MMYLAAPASVDVNGARIAGLGVGEVHTGSVPLGDTEISVSAWSAPGRSSLKFKAEPGKSYKFLVAPRNESLFAGMAAGLIGQAIEGGGPFSVARVP